MGRTIILQEVPLLNSELPPASINLIGTVEGFATSCCLLRADIPAVTIQLKIAEGGCVAGRDHIAGEVCLGMRQVSRHG